MFDLLRAAPTTRILVIASAVLGVLSLSGLMSPLDMFYSPKMIFTHRQYWRFVTSLLYFGDISFMMLMQVFSFIQFMATIESQIFTGRPEDFLTFLAFGCPFFWLFGRVACIPFLSDPLVSYALYYWAKHFGDQKIQITALPIQIPVQFMPVVCLALTWYRAGFIVCLGDVIGFAAAQLFFFIRDVVSIEYDLSLLRAPTWLARFVQPLRSD
jgi:Derlin-2/3